MVSARHLRRSLLFYEINTNLARVFLLFRFLFFSFYLYFYVANGFHLPLCVLVYGEVVLIFVPNGRPPR